MYLSRFNAPVLVLLREMNCEGLAIRDVDLEWLANCFFQLVLVGCWNLRVRDLDLVVLNNHSAGVGPVGCLAMTAQNLDMSLNPEIRTCCFVHTVTQGRYHNILPIC